MLLYAPAHTPDRFECVCNGFAEFTRFADREFYQDWWNATSMDVFSRKWNKVGPGQGLHNESHSLPPWAHPSPRPSPPPPHSPCTPSS